MSYLFDHRQIADEMEIFVLNEQVGAGLPLWLPNGVAIRDELESFIRECEQRQGYQRVVCPHLGKAKLYQQSGHLEFFRENMFPPLKWPEGSAEYFLKPMNCPHHHLVFASSPRSYRGLPLRIAEYGQVYRFENSGSLHGLSRARGLCQNDAHIYLDPAHAEAEIDRVLDLHEHCYRALGLESYRYRLSKRAANRPGDFQGPEALWLRCEAILRSCLERKGLPYYEAEGEAAFYGPKIDVQMRIGAKEESIASVQLDFLSAERFDLSFMASSGERVRPWVIHRAPLGSHERFVAMLLEYYDGRLPGWLAPVQLYVLPVSEAQLDEARLIVEQLVAAGIRAKLDESAGSLSKRVLFAHRYRPLAKLIVGPKELASGRFRLQLREEALELWRVNLIDEMRKLLRRPAVISG